ncbi:hypothetical protein PTSG_03616 [Salpingoeca rosetta]|uniref:Staphylococcal nuclease domain-containing protein 1 n=1 Tax=Salpingoeca rosetta (strain ATCC 50818 / BSB-021) TaxID=946362 RepID=F2U638_SALR5|nr:uncharacterized protein PTSG_03616 [Salpingoeca rosetta]EGD82979.1 hypothetical protein PTSG_03616 [Salpingoeca rosetta]|eukprot:XP_004995343.1 hypothetical protein PTSG_03616 [Salpingoeca rosetta]
MPKRGEAVVKAVLSGDTVVLRGHAASGPPPTFTLSLAQLECPRLAKRPPQGQDQGQQDEPYAWEARELVRKKVIGKRVSFFVEYTVPSGREFGHIILNRDTANEEYIAVSLLDAGLARIREGSRGTGDVFEKMQAAQTKAESSHIGIWDEKSKPKHVRKITWNVENMRALVDKNKGKPVKAVIEHVRDGCTLRAFLLPNFEYITFSLTGVKTPMFKRDAEGNEVAEPFAAEAKFFVESRLLNRDVDLILEGSSGNVFLATPLMGGRNISEHLLKAGLAKIVDWSISSLTGGAATYRAAQQYAQANKLKLWKNFASRKELSLSPSDQSFKAKVVEIVNPEQYVIERDGVQQRIHLASLRQPKHPREPGSRAPRFYEVPFGYETREFLRKKLIDQTVDVKVDYVKPANNGFPAKTCCTITIGGVNVAEALISKGYATALRHREDDDARSSVYDDLLAAETRAVKNNKGIHTKSEVPIHRIAEVTNKQQADKFYSSMRRETRVSAVVEHVVSGSRVRALIPKHTCVVSVVFAGISCPRTGRDDTPDQPFAREALDFTKTYCHQRDVELELEDVDKNGNFVAHVFVNRENLSVKLLENGLAKVHGSVRRFAHKGELEAAEQAAKDKRVNLFKDFDPEKEKAEKEAALGPTAATTRKHAPEPVLVTEIASTNSFYVQGQKSSAELEKVMQSLASSNGAGAGAFKPKKGAMCAAQFTLDNVWYRAKITDVSGSNVTVQYIDFGNKETLPAKRCAPLPAGTSSLPAQARLVTLAGIAPAPADWEAEAQNVVADLLLDKSFMCNSEYRDSEGEHVTLTTMDGKVDQGRELIACGYGRVDKQAPPLLDALMKKYRDAQARAIAARDGMWIYGDVTEDDQ